MKHTLTVLAVLLCATLHAQAQTSTPSSALDALVADTRKRSSEMRAQGIKEELAKDGAHMSGPWLYDWIMALLFDSPFLKARWEDPKIYAGAGPFRAVYDMDKSTVTESKK